MSQIILYSKILLIYCFCVGSIACTDQNSVEINKEAEASYNRLCKIYDDLNHLKLSDNEIADRLVTRIYSEVPELTNVTKHIFSAPPQKTYGLYKQVAEQDIGIPWECPAIKEYYTLK